MPVEEIAEATLDVAAELAEAGGNKKGCRGFVIGGVIILVVGAIVAVALL